jgi:hypothetical protein
MADQPLLYTAQELAAIKKRIRRYMEEGTEVLEARLKNRVDNAETKGCLTTACIALDARRHCEVLCEAYIEYPPHLFYTDRETHATVLRIYGMDKVEREGQAQPEAQARTICALMGINNLNTRSLEELVHVKEWSAAKQELLSSGLYREPTVFTEWDGFLTASASIDHRQ